jgi:hypothetical protein
MLSGVAVVNRMFAFGLNRAVTFTAWWTTNVQRGELPSHPPDHVANRDDASAGEAVNVTAAPSATVAVQLPVVQVKSEVPPLVAVTLPVDAAGVSIATVSFGDSPPPPAHAVANSAKQERSLMSPLPIAEARYPFLNSA